MFLHKLFCTVLGIGYIGKGGGSVAALVCCFGWMLIWDNGPHDLVQVLGTLVLIAAGVWSSGKLEAAWGKDSSRIVVDEVAGMCVSLLWIPVRVEYVLISFLLFRFFDIAKPLFIRRIEKLPAGWGVMFDDLLAGVYANVVLQIFIVIFRK